MRRAPESHTAAQNRRGRVSDGSRSYGRSKVPRHKGQRHMTGSPLALRRRKQGDPPMRIYIFGNDGITLSREPPAAVSEGEIVVSRTSAG